MVVAVAIAASLGAVARHLVDGAVRRWTATARPLGTVAVNVTGSFLLGFLAGLSLHHGLAGPVPDVVGTGFVGAYTTFSTFSYETVRLFERGAYRHAFHNVAVNTGGGLAAAAAGLVLAATLSS